MEHMNSTFKDNISTFSPHLSQTSVQKTAHAAPIVEERIATFGHHMSIKQDSGYHAVPTTTRTGTQSFSTFLTQEHAIMFLRELTHTTRIAVAIYAVTSGSIANGPNSLSGSTTN